MKAYETDRRFRAPVVEVLLFMLLSLLPAALFGGDVEGHKHPEYLAIKERQDPSFPQQRYWKGAVWPPLNFLTYLSLRRAGFADAASELAEKSRALLLSEWRRQGYVSENYSSITGTGDDDRLSSDRFHSWGALLGIMSFIESGEMPAPEKAIPRDR